MRQLVRAGGENLVERRGDQCGRYTILIVDRGGAGTGRGVVAVVVLVAVLALLILLVQRTVCACGGVFSFIWNWQKKKSWRLEIFLFCTLIYKHISSESESPKVHFNSKNRAGFFRCHQSEVVVVVGDTGAGGRTSNENYVCESECQPFLLVSLSDLI